ncbi:MAG: fused response regulator/phosphatase [Proteobacteria bacterium]|nr:fused response regulator/phosphatase [Pseudomonadota bacterium]
MESYEEAKILIVDDQKHNRDLIKFFLQQTGIILFLEAENTQQAIEQALKHTPDLIFLDINLGDDSGFDVCRKLKELYKTKDIPVLFLSSYTEPENKVTGYKLGAVDFVNKPINHYEIIARTRVHLKNGQLLKQLQNYQNRTSRELEKAKQTQNAILPSNTEVHTFQEQYMIKIESVFQSSSELAGDYWKIIKLDENNVAFILTDFSGHGVYSALNTVRIDLLISQATKETLQDPKLAIQYLNTELYKILPKEDFCSIVYLTLNTETGNVEYTGSNTPDIYVLKSDYSYPVKFSAQGFPLALSRKIDDSDYTYNTFKLESGDTLLMYSDALLEETHKNSTRWLDKGLLTVLKTIQDKQIKNKCGYILKEFNNTVKQPLKDDLTIICITRENHSQLG